MNVFIEVKLRMNMRDWDAFQQLISEQIKDPQVLDIEIDKAHLHENLGIEEPKPEITVQVPVQTPEKVTPAKNAWPRKKTRGHTKVTPEIIMTVREMKSNYPAMTHKEIRRVIASQEGKEYGVSTISEILSGNKYNAKLTREQLKEYPPIKTYEDKK